MRGDDEGAGTGDGAGEDDGGGFAIGIGFGVGGVYEAGALPRAWLPDIGPEDDDPLGGTVTGLDVPEATAAEVTGALGRLLGATAPVGSPDPEALLIARVFVVDEHPSAVRWSEGERRTVAGLAAALVAHRGEEGVEALVRELRRTARGDG
ncbi:hypothetical protein DEJ45_01030 [Streptomyces venezuelae]|uniref:hypothetical protein n=1 Tax=Streptomyces venezuelae TaxID=54571 RepID=UPI00123C9499|nr:hypothetical protein [Streptomyces venezuelae]QES11151.1 hypothetical protein DEJ45_01030 [Streptomyces venezuelae]